MNNFIDQSYVIRFMIVAIGVVAIIAGMRAIASILNPIFIAILVAVLFDIPRTWLIRRGWSGGAALGVTILASLVMTLLFLFFMGRTFVNMTASLPAYQEQLQAQLGELGAMLARVGIDANQLRSVTEIDSNNPLQVITYMLGAVVSLLSSAILILVYAVFLLIEASTFPGKLNEAFSPSEPAYKYLDKVTTNLRNFLVAQTQVSLYTGIGVFAANFLLGVQFALLWGLVAFLMNFIPYIGSILAGIPAVIVAFIQFGPSPTVLLLIGAYLLVNIIINNTIYPRVMSQGVDISMFIVLAAMLFWGWVLGPIGLILSVPITAVIKISLESYPGTRWLAVMLGSGAGRQKAE